MGRSGLQPLADKVLGGNLGSLLRERRADGISYAQIARELDHDHGIAVTGETIRTWCRELGVEAA